MESLGLSQNDGSSGINGEGELRGQPANPCSPGEMDVKTVCVFNDNDNDKRLGLMEKADQPDHKKIQYTKNKNGQ